MADQSRIVLRPFHGTPKTIIMRELPVASLVTTKIYLRSLHTTPTTIIMGDPTVAPPGAPGFPTQYPGLRFYDNGSVQSLCLVAVADAPSGDRLTIWKGGVPYAVYLVDTTDPNASTIRIQTESGVKALRLLT